MKTIPLGNPNNGKFAMIDDCDYELVSQYKWRRNGGYVQSRSTINGKTKYLYMHRLILGITDRLVLTDHINRIKHDNRRENLRLCNDSQNNMNKYKQSTYKGNPCSSKYKGVDWRKKMNKWRVRIKDPVLKNQTNIGYYHSETEAALAYNAKAIELFGEFALLNTIE